MSENYSFKISKKMREKWKKFAKENGLSVSMLIRLSVSEYIRNIEKDLKIGQLKSDKENEKKELKLQMNNLGDKIEDIVKTMKEKEDLKKDFEKKDKLKAQAIAILKRFPEGLNHNELSELLAIKKVELSNFLLYMSDNSLIMQKKGVVKLL